MAVCELHNLWLSQQLHPNLLLSSFTANSWTPIAAFSPPSTANVLVHGASVTEKLSE